jgi:rubredoxin
MEKYKCVICGFVYDPQEGDPDSGIGPGISFNDLPDDYICPVCGAGKEEFERID